MDRSKFNSAKTSMLFMLFALQVALAIGCQGKEKTVSSSPTPSPTPTDPGTAPPDVVNNIGFYVKNISTDKYTSFMTKGTSYDTDCSIAPDTVASQDITCRIDAMEGDLGFHGEKLNFNVPPSICKYMVMTPYWYYNYEVGRGPKQIEMDILQSGSNVTASNCKVTQQDSTVVTNCALGSQLEVDFNTGKGSYTCKYDQRDFDGPNCCFGDYVEVLNYSGDKVGTETNNKNWGGKYGDCISGPGKFDWDRKSVDGVPVSTIYFAEDGLNKSFDVKGPLDRKLGNNYLVSNYYHPTRHTHNGFVSPLSSTKPYAIDPIDDRDGSLITATSDAFVFECLDSAFEVKHRIKLYTREWNTYTEFLTFQTSAGVSGDADKQGVEGVDCDYSSFPGSGATNCNDMWDWDDLLNWIDLDLSIVTDIYDTSPGQEAGRSRWFPQEQ